MTIHRDLNQLQERGLVRRIHGGVTAEKSVSFESSFQFRMLQANAEKTRLARAAAEYVSPGDAIVLDDSTTTFNVLEFIEQLEPLTVLTNSVAAIARLKEFDNINLVGIGGSFNRQFNGFFGLACEQMLESFRVDTAIMSTTTVHGTSIHSQEEEVVRAKRAMLKISKTRILLADASKFSGTALHYIADLREFDHVLISGDMSPEHLSLLSDAGVNYRYLNND
jgi:DeoR/GlpR family transcriptional regulator of sugar metabolism